MKFEVSCAVCKTVFESSKKSRSNLCANPACKSTFLKTIKTIPVSPEMVEKIAEQKRLGLHNEQIAAEHGLTLYKLKEIIKQNNLYLTKEQKKSIPYQSKLAKDPNCMDKMRQKITPESRKKQSETIIQTYQERPEWKKEIGKRSKEWWVNLPESEKQATLEKRGKSLSLSKLGFAKDAEKEELFNNIKRDIENNVDTLPNLAKKYNISHSTVCRGFHARGWSYLVGTAVSSGQLDVYNYMKSVLPHADMLLSDRSTIGRELDVYCPSRSFAVEYNGLFFHSEAAREAGLTQRVRGRHLEKFKRCEKAGVQLLAIYEDEWSHPQKQILLKAMIDHRLGISKSEPISASKLNLVRFDKNKQFKHFFEKNHIDGHANAMYALALTKDDGEIVMCASIRKTSKGLFEIARMATDLKYRVLGGASRLVKHMPRPIYSYSNNRLSTGDVYKKLGFRFVKDTNQSSYWYTDLNVRVFRTKCRRINKSEILASLPTEESQALNGAFSQKLFGDDRPLYRIEDYGHKLWVLE